MQALGLIETRGLLAAIVCADVMLKAAQVELVERTFVGGGLVTITVTGDVGAVKAAVEAGAAAVEQLDHMAMVSQHVIPRPHQEIEGIVVTGSSSRQNQQVSTCSKEDEEAPIAGEPQSAENVPDSEETSVSEEVAEAEKTDEAQESDAETEDNTEDESTEEAAVEAGDENTVQTAAGTANPGQMALSSLHKDKIDELIHQSGIEKGMELLRSVSVVKLRRLAREYSELDIKGRAVSKAGKSLLMKTFQKYYDKITPQA